MTRTLPNTNIFWKTETRTRETLIEAALSAVSARDASGFFRHCG